MDLSPKVRVKEKIRYDINIHREQNKKILINSRRGVLVEEDTNKVFTVENMRNLALEVKRRKRITDDHLRLLKHAFLNGQDFILAFYNVQGAIDSLLHYASSKIFFLSMLYLCYFKLLKNYLFIYKLFRYNNLT